MPALNNNVQDSLQPAFTDLTDTSTAKENCKSVLMNGN